MENSLLIIIGCALDLVSGDIAFFKNGRCLGIAFTVPKELHDQLFYPTIALRNMSVKVDIFLFITDILLDQFRIKRIPILSTSVPYF